MMTLNTLPVGVDTLLARFRTVWASKRSKGAPKVFQPRFYTSWASHCYRALLASLLLNLHGYHVVNPSSAASVDIAKTRRAVCTSAWCQCIRYRAPQGNPYRRCGIITAYTFRKKSLAAGSFKGTHKKPSPRYDKCRSLPSISRKKSMDIETMHYLYLCQAVFENLRNARRKQLFATPPGLQALEKSYAVPMHKIVNIS